MQSREHRVNLELQDMSGPFLYGTLNRRGPHMTLPRPRSDRLGSESGCSSIGIAGTNNHIHQDLPVMTSSISAYNTTGAPGQDIWTPMTMGHHQNGGHIFHHGIGKENYQFKISPLDGVTIKSAVIRSFKH